MGGRVGDVADVAGAELFGPLAEGHQHTRLGQDGWRRVVDIVGIGVADRLGEHVFVGHRDAVLGQIGRLAPGIPTAGDDRLEATPHRPFGCGSDSPGFVDVDPQGAFLPDDGQHGLPGRHGLEAFLGDFLGLGIGGGLGEEGVDFTQLAVPVSDLVFE